jgi:excisionase family DNA binding protein
MTTMSNDHAMYSLDEAAALLRCSRWTLRDQVTRGEVPHHRRGRVKGVYFTLANLEEIVASQARGVRPGSASRPSSTSVAGPSLPVPAEFNRLRKRA